MDGLYIMSDLLIKLTHVLKNIIRATVYDDAINQTNKRTFFRERNILSSLCKLTLEKHYSHWQTLPSWPEVFIYGYSYKMVYQHCMKDEKQTKVCSGVLGKVSVTPNDWLKEKKPDNVPLVTICQ